MLSSITRFFWPLILLSLILIGTSTSLDQDTAPNHLNFFRSALHGRRRVVTCAGDPNVCSDRDKNPWGGNTCCFGQYCKDTLRDANNCGGCGVRCGYGLLCCDGRCADVRNDPQHCGSCFEGCPGQGRCSFGMCDYGG